MRNDNKPDTLKEFGDSFQNKVISILLHDAKFLSTILDVLNVEFFDDDASQWIVETIKNHFIEYSKLPTLDVFSIEYKKLTSEAIKRDVRDKLKLTYELVGSDDFEYIKDKFRTFCKNQKLKNAILKSVDYLSLGQYENIAKEVNDAMLAGDDVDIGLNYIDDLDFRFSTEARETVPTPWPAINYITNGGGGKGELFCCMAPSGIGKTWILSAIGANAITLGYNVVHYTLELSEVYVGKRYDTILTGIDQSEQLMNRDKIESILGKKVSGKLIIKNYPTKMASTFTLKLHLERLISSGFTPDLVIVDYGDLLTTNKNSRTDSKYEDLGIIYEELRGLAGEKEVPIWTASQANRESLHKDIIDTDSIADSYAKVMASDFIMSISRKPSDKMKNTARFFVAKNRFGRDGITYNSVLNTANGVILIDALPKGGTSNEDTDVVASVEAKKLELKNKFGEF